jgi:hypothetical protein
VRLIDREIRYIIWLHIAFSGFLFFHIASILIFFISVLLSFLKKDSTTRLMNLLWSAYGYVCMCACLNFIF